MKKLMAGRTAVLVAACMPALIAGAARAAPLEAYGRLPAMDQVAISPDGSKIAFAQSINGKTAVVVDQLSPASVVLNLPPSDLPVRALIWADATHLLVVKPPAAGGAITFGETYVVQSVDIEKRKVTPLLNFTDTLVRTEGPGLANTASEMPQVSTVKGHTTVFLRGATVDGAVNAPALMSSDLAAAKDQVVERGISSDPGRRWIVDDQGNQIAQTKYEDFAKTWSLRIKQGGNWVEVYAAKAPALPPQVLGLNGDGTLLLLQMVKDGGGAEYRSVSLADGKVSGPLADYEGYATLIRDPMTQRVIGGVKMGMEPSYVFFDAKDQAGWNAVLASFPNEQVDPVSWSRDRSRAIVRLTGVKHGIAYAFVDLGSHKAAMIGQAYQGVTADDLADVNIVKYPAQDGQMIQAFLTVPIGREFKNLPLIVLAHDGPAGRDQAGFDWQAQALASRGYAVLQPQFRGSTGFDPKLEAAGAGEFGRKMQSDLSDGVRALASKGYIDPKRVCIVGVGYGGYAALAGVTLEQGVYRCAVAVAGASDLRKLMVNRPAGPFGPPPPSPWERFVGAKGPTDPLYEQISPASHAAQAAGPVLLIHAQNDAVAPIQQSWDMEAALKKANKPVELVTLTGDDHGLAREATRLQTLQATVAFLEKNNPPK